jgi:hypothetical protein
VTGHAFCESKYRRIRLKTVQFDYFRRAGQRHPNGERVALHPARQNAPDQNRCLASAIVLALNSLSFSLFRSRSGRAMGTVLRVSPSQEGRVNGCSHNVTPFHGLAQKVLKNQRERERDETKKNIWEFEKKQERKES